MRFGPRTSLAALLLAVSVVAGFGREAAQTEPVSLHAANAAQAADVAKQAAKVAHRVAEHSQEVAHDTAEALRYTRDALKRAGANAEDVAQVGNEAEKLESEMGRQDEAGRHDSAETRAAVREAESQEDSSRRITQEVHSGGSGGGQGIERSLDVNSEISDGQGGAGGVEPFGQEEPAKVLTKESVKQSDGMIKQIEAAQGVEAKRSVYRALTKLRGATIASYDGVARAHLKNVDNYNKKHKWRDEHPMRHLAEEEADTHIWAFPKKGSSKKAAKKKAPKKKAPAGNNMAASPAPAPAA